MALVAYSDSEASDSDSEASDSDSEASDSENEQVAQQAPKPDSPTAKPNKSSAPGFQPLVDRSNPRKIRVALPEIKPENTDGAEGEDGGPARKRAKLGGGGSFSGFNSLLPAPKRTANASGALGGADKKGSSARKVFSLKTGATPGFDRQADTELRQEQAEAGPSSTTDGIDDIPTAGSLAGEKYEGDAAPKKLEERVKKGNAMMFKPLSVARNTTKRKPKAAVFSIETTSTTESSQPAVTESTKPALSIDRNPAPAPKPKPKVSLFSISREEETTVVAAPQPQTQTSTYEPLVYNTTNEESVQDAASALPQTSDNPAQASSNGPQSLEDIANDLNLSRAQKRQLFGRQGMQGPSQQSASRILTFNTDAEYASNAAYLSQASEAELAAMQHNPVRAIAPGKHSLQQLVNAASNQREALEDSFASGKRNKKEAGSKYGW